MPDSIRNSVLNGSVMTSVIMPITAESVWRRLIAAGHGSWRVRDFSA
jgi:hypothetical protein